MAELWDIYDRNGRRTGRTVDRQAFFSGAVRLAPGEYHRVVIVVMVSPRGEIFCTRRSPGKHYPGMWENSGGSVLAGEDSLSAAVRELREETGVALEPEALELIYRQERGPNTLYDIYFTVQDVPLDDIVLQEGETDAARWFPYEEWERLGRAGEILTPAGADCGEFFEKLKKRIESKG